MIRLNSSFPLNPSLTGRPSYGPCPVRKQDRVHTRWSDAYPPAHVLALKLHELHGQVAYGARYSLLTPKGSVALFRSISSIGGKEGWFHGNWLWRIRGMLDRILLGVDPFQAERAIPTWRSMMWFISGAWRIFKQAERLLLRAEMKLPGKAWLEFHIREEEGQRRLSVVAYYDTHTLSGRVYWYIFLPFHHFLFKNLFKAIEKRS